jgi:hypothetical protein
MMLPVLRANAVLDGEYISGDRISLHTAYSTTGANEITGGSYVRVAATFSAATSRIKAISAAVDITGLPAAASIAFVGLWNSAGTVFKGMAPNGADEKSFQVGITANTIICEGHGLVNDDRACILGTPPAGLTEGTIYFVVGVTAGDPDTLQLSTTQGGAAIDLTGQPGSEAVLSKVIVEVYSGAGGTHRVNTWQTKL